MTINIASTFFTTLAIKKIFQITNALSKTNSHVMIDKKILVVHVVVLCLYLIAALGYIIPSIRPSIKEKSWSILYCTTTIVDLLV